MPHPDGMVLPESFYLRPRVLAISRGLLGKFLCTCLPVPGGNRSRQPALTTGMIVETEAYAGPWDRASHAHGNRCTARTRTMFLRGGIAYVYFCYGMHAMFNVVTHQEGIPHAILIRAIMPIEGIPVMLRRRNLPVLTPRLTAGPGSLTRALGITTAHDATGLQGPMIWIEDRGVRVTTRQILASPRVGVSYAGTHATLPYRFRLRNNPWTSPAS